MEGCEGFLLYPKNGNLFGYRNNQNPQFVGVLEYSEHPRAGVPYNLIYRIKVGSFYG